MNDTGGSRASALRKKASTGGAAESAGMTRWLLTYADMITLLLALFIILFAISNISKVKFQTLARDISGGFNGEYAINNPPNGGAVGKEPGRMGDADLLKIKKQIDDYAKKRNLTDKVQTKITRRGLVVSLLTDKALYDSGSADLRPETRALIDEVHTAIGTNTNNIRVEGYTDDVPIQSSDYPSNWELSAARATNVVRYMIEKDGIAPTRMSSAGYGQYRPTFKNDTEDHRRLNRKVQIVIENRQTSAEESEK